MNELYDLFDQFVGETITHIDCTETNKGQEIWVQCGDTALVIGYERRIGMYVKQFLAVDEVIH